MSRSQPSTLRRLAAVAVALMVALSACGGDDDSSDPAPDRTTSSTSTPRDEEPDGSTGTADDALDAGATDHGRVVALAEEFLLADILTLGIEPIASSATVDAVGFQGLDDFDTSGIEVLPMTTLSLEHLATLRPDTIVTLQYWVDQLGADVLGGMAEVVVVPDGLYGPERLTVLGDLLDRPEHAAAAVEEYEAALAAARDRVPDDCTISLATIYAGPSVAAFVDGPWEIPTSLQLAGCTLDPGPSDAEPDRNGRAWLSLEQLGLLGSDILVLMQTDTVEGEPDAVDEIEANPLWQALPAVQNDRVIVFDRLGYPGLQGQIRFLAELDALAG